MEVINKIAEELYGNEFRYKVDPKRFEEVATVLQALLTKYKIPQGDVGFIRTIMPLVIETLYHPTRDLDGIFEGTLTGYEEVEKELPGMFKDQYLVTLELLKYFREQKKV